MTIKELFKMVEDANKVATLFETEYAVLVTDGDDGWEETFATFEEYKKWVNEEINKPWADVLLGDGTLHPQGEGAYYLFTHVDLVYSSEKFTPDFEIVKKKGENQ